MCIIKQESHTLAVVGLAEGRFVGRLVGDGKVDPEDVHRPFEPHCFEQQDVSNLPLLKHTHPSGEQFDDETSVPLVLDEMGCGVGFLVGRFVGVGVTKLLLHRPSEPQNFEQHDVSV